VEGDACSTPALKIEIDRLVEFRHHVSGRLRVPRRRSVFARRKPMRRSPEHCCESAYGQCHDSLASSIKLGAWLSAGTLRSLD
jgi:hypothetical protein